MNRTMASLVFAGLSVQVLIVTPSAAETHLFNARPVTEDVVAHPIAGTAVINAFHGEAGARRVAGAMLDRSLADPRISDIFKGHDLVRLRQQLGDHMCWILGGPCAYSGKSMLEAHHQMGIQEANLTALIENLQAAMDAEHVPSWAQNKLLAKLAPFKRAVVER